MMLYSKFSLPHTKIKSQEKVLYSRPSCFYASQIHQSERNTSFCQRCKNTGAKPAPARLTCVLQCRIISKTCYGNLFFSLEEEISRWAYSVLLSYLRACDFSAVNYTKKKKKKFSEIIQTETFTVELKAWQEFSIIHGDISFYLTKCIDRNLI